MRADKPIMENGFRYIVTINDGKLLRHNCSYVTVHRKTRRIEPTPLSRIKRRRVNIKKKISPLLTKQAVGGEDKPKVPVNSIMEYWGGRRAGNASK
jgi:hypothetical protein